MRKLSLYNDLEMGKIRYIKLRSKDEVSEYLADTLIRHLDAGERVLWLLSGGSSITIEVKTANLMSKRTGLSRLSVTLLDERYGPIGHEDSNWQQLIEAGFKLNGATLQPVLTGESLNETVKEYASSLEKDLNRADYTLAVVGMGTDGHVLGIKPGSPAVNSRQLVEGYLWDDYTRLTMTPKVIALIDEAVVYAVGDEKKPQLDKLDRALSVDEQPAQILKTISKVTIFNDYKGEKV